MTTEAKREAIARIIAEVYIIADRDTYESGDLSFSEWIDANWRSFCGQADAIMALAEPQVSDDTVRVAKPLFWRKGTDHPQDSEGKWMADGLSGRYSAEKQRDGTWLLWWAHDNFAWERCATFAEVKEKAEVDWQKRFAERLTAAPASEPQALSEERAREVLAQCTSNPDRALEVRGGIAKALIPASDAIRAMIRFATETQKGSGE